MQKQKNNSVQAEAVAPSSGTEWLAAHPFLEGISGPQLVKLAEWSMPVEFEAGQLIFREGEPANRFYLLQQGKVALESQGDDGEPLLIQILGPGEVLGWSWLFPPYYWHFDARALDPVKATFFYGTRLREQCEDDPALGYQLVKRMAEVMMQRLQATRRQLLAASALALRSQKTGLRAIARKRLIKAPPAEGPPRI